MADITRAECGQIVEHEDEFEIEVSDYRTGAVSGWDAWRLSNGRAVYTEPAGAAHDMPEDGRTVEVPRPRSPFAPYLSRRQRASRAAVSLGVVVAAFLAITLIFAPFLYAGLRPTSAQPLPHGADRFYFVPSVPWGVVELDGSELTHRPEVGSGHPLQLARGTHTLEWLADPFIPFHCSLSVPHAHTDTCATQPLLDSLGAFTGTLITEHESLLSLPLHQLMSLKMAIQTAIRDTGSSVTIQPGEHYRYPLMLGNQQFDQIAVADQTLTATMSVVPTLQTGQSEPCGMYPAHSEILPLCRAPGQDCRDLCTLSPAKGVHASSNAWLAAITARIVWTYSTPDGKVTAQDAANYKFNRTLVVLRFVWTGTEWQVSPLIGDGAHLAAANDISCESAREWLIDGVEEEQLKSDVPTIINGSYRSTANAAAGCVVILPASAHTGGTFPSAPLQTEMPTFLGRFGMLVAANDAAHALWPTLPQATPHERLIAEALSHG